MSLSYRSWDARKAWHVSPLRMNFLIPWEYSNKRRMKRRNRWSWRRSSLLSNPLRRKTKRSVSSWRLASPWWLRCSSSSAGRCRQRMPRLRWRGWSLTFKKVSAHASISHRCSVELPITTHMRHIFHLSRSRMEETKTLLDLMLRNSKN